MNGTSLVLRLQHIINFSEQESNVDARIARYLLQNLHKETISLSKVSEACYTSSSSISRFAQKIGYKNFNELKTGFQEAHIDKEEMKLDVSATRKMDLYEDKEFIKHNTRIIIQDLEQYLQEIDLQVIEHLCELIFQYPNVSLYATAIPGNIAEMIQHQLLTIGKYVECYPLILDQVNSSKRLDENSLAIFISLEGSYVMQKRLTLGITGSPAHSVLITQNPTMKLSTNFNEIVSLGSHSHVDSGKYKLLLFVETLIHRYYVKYL